MTDIPKLQKVISIIVKLIFKEYMTQICHINLLPSVHGKKTDRPAPSQESNQAPRGNSAKTRNEELGSIQPQSTLSKALGSILRVTYTQEEYTWPILHVKIFQYIYTYINDGNKFRKTNKSL